MDDQLEGASSNAMRCFSRRARCGPRVVYSDRPVVPQEGLCAETTAGPPVAFDSAHLLEGAMVALGCLVRWVFSDGRCGGFARRPIGEVPAGADELLWAIESLLEDGEIDSGAPAYAVA